MREISRKKAVRQETTPEQLVMLAMLDARSTLHEAIVAAGLGVLGAMLEEDRTRLCGARYAHDADRRASRAGYADAELPMGGRRIQMKRPRVRGADGHEVALPTWDRFASADPLSSRAVEQMVLGVSTRNYARSLEPTPRGVRGRGTSKSAVDRRFVAETQKQLDEMMSRDLSSIPVCALMIDGIHMSEHLVLVALGIDESGEKHVLGLYDGATENATVCTGLLSDLAARGMRSDRSMLFVIDGSKALRKAIRDVFGQRAIVQRCQVHKRRNLCDHLPEEMKKSVGQTISMAYKSTDAARAKRMLEALARQLDKKFPAAATSLREGLDETLTVMRMKLPAGLARTLATTNPIEFINGRIRKTTHNVAKWDSGQMVLRWLALAVREAAKTFRRLRGHKSMPVLLAALRANDQQLNPNAVDASSKAA